MTLKNIIFLNIPQVLNEIQKTENPVIISEKNIFRLYPFLFNNQNIPHLILNINEKQKNFHTAKKIWDFLIQNNITKSHTIFIIGGGVLHDVTLFACSVFKRGIPTIS
ncbi:MAG: hypothetical protein D6799_01645, partial [Bacteroidetes bacterium]